MDNKVISPMTQRVNNLLANAGDTGDSGSIPGLGRSPGEGNGNLLQYSRLENPMGRGAWRATVHGQQSVRHNQARNLSFSPYSLSHQPLESSVLHSQECVALSMLSLTQCPSDDLSCYMKASRASSGASLAPLLSFHSWFSPWNQRHGDVYVIWLFWLFRCWFGDL